MQDVGKKLREERLRQGKSITEMAEQIHFTAGQIEAIEDGNLDYFKDDLTYMKFRVQYYCKALGVDFSQFKESFDDEILSYTTTLNKSDVEFIRRENARLNQKVKDQANGKKKKKKLRFRVDVSTISMLIIGILMIAILSFAFGRYIFPNLVQNENKPSNEEVLVTSIPSITEITSNSTTTTTHETTPIETTTEEGCKVELIENDKLDYTIKYSKNCTKVDMSINFKNKSWIGAYVDGQQIANHTYTKNQSVTLNLTPGVNKKLLVNMGVCKGQEFRINDEVVTLDPSVSSDTGANKITFTLKGE